MRPPDSAPTASVIIPAFTLDRWELLADAVASVELQTRPPVELVLCIDRNAELLARCEERWATHVTPAGFPIVVVANRFDQDEGGASAHARAHGVRRRFGAGWARNSGAEVARGDVLVFLDDDAAAAPDWLEHLLAPYADPAVVAVGGAPLPAYETGRPRWFPDNFDWVFGCAYEGLPTELAPLGHLIGANMSVRRWAFEEIGGFHSIDFDDLDLCMRLGSLHPPSSVLFEPGAIVRHHVPAEEGRVEVLLASLLLRQPREGRSLRYDGRCGERPRRARVRPEGRHRPGAGGSVRRREGRVGGLVAIGSHGDRPVHGRRRASGRPRPAAPPSGTGIRPAVRRTTGTGVGFVIDGVHGFPRRHR